MQGADFDEGEFFRAIERSGARVLLIGRRAMVAYGLPVLTADYDLWIDADEAGALNAALAPLGLRPTARCRGRSSSVASPRRSTRPSGRKRRL